MDFQFASFMDFGPDVATECRRLRKRREHIHYCQRPGDLEQFECGLSDDRARFLEQA